MLPPSEFINVTVNNAAPPCGRKGEISMDCTEAYKEHIMYSFNGFCKVVIGRAGGIDERKELSG
jgi:hypothetical protein